MANRTVSIVMPLHNKGKYIQETLDSVMTQSFEDWELLVVENGSADDAPEPVAKVSDSRVRLILRAS